MPSIPQPGVEVLTQQTTVSPTIVRPQLIPCIVGPCMEIVSLLDSVGAINAQARVTTPAAITGTNTGATKTVDATHTSLLVRIDGGAAQTVTLPVPTSSLLTAAFIASQIDTQATGMSVSVSATNQIQFESSTTGDQSSIEFQTIANDVYTELGLDAFVGVVVRGADTYQNQDVTFPFTALPAERGDASQMQFDADDITMWRVQAGVTREFEPDGA